MTEKMRRKIKDKMREKPKEVDENVEEKVKDNLDGKETKKLEEPIITMNIKYIDTNGEPTVKARPINEFKHSEDFMFDFLEELGVGPIYRSMFGIIMVDGKEPNCWLAPNEILKDLLKPLDPQDKNIPSLFRLAVRFIPSSISRLQAMDQSAFNLLFAQIRYDFLYNPRVLSNQKKSHILLDDKILGLIATDALRNAVEAKQSPDDKSKKSIQYKIPAPRAAPKWQRLLLKHFKEPLQLDKTIKSFVKNCTQDVKIIKVSFIEHFIRNVCLNYMDQIHRLGPDGNSGKAKKFIRITYRQTRDSSSCYLELKNTELGKSWVFLCDIQSICFATIIEGHKVEINRSQDISCIDLRSNFSAKSFLSSIDGYHRLTKKWHSVYFCQQVLSPDLEFLHKNKIHGPIHSDDENKKRKIRPGSFLVRRSRFHSNTYIIDAQLEPRLWLEVELISKDKENFKIDKSCLNKQKYNLNLPDSYDLKTLIDSIEIVVQTENKSSCPPYQLTHWIPPSEYDDHLLLLICMSKDIFKKLIDSKGKNKVAINSLDELPRYVPHSMLEFGNRNLLKSNDNSLLVRQARFNKEHKVIIKELLENELSSFNTSCYIKNFHNRNSLYPGNFYDESRLGNKKTICIHKYQSSKTANYSVENSRTINHFRLIDWVFLKHPLFAETVGLSGQSGISVVQEFLPDKLDGYLLANQKSINHLDFKTICHQLACGLIFLQEKRIVHGKLRCHNIFLRNLKPLTICITDPLGTIDVKRELAFIPPECDLIGNENILINGYDSGFDVWSYGTVIWQIHSYGAMPPKEVYGNTLVRPEICPDKLWNLAESCWLLETTSRATPQTIYRDVIDCLDREQDSFSFHYFHSTESRDQLLQDDKTIPKNNGLKLALWDEDSISSMSTGSSLKIQTCTASTKSSETEDLDALLLRRKPNEEKSLHSTKSNRDNFVNSINGSQVNHKGGFTYFLDLIKRSFHKDTNETTNSMDTINCTITTTINEVGNNCLKESNQDISNDLISLSKSTIPTNALTFVTDDSNSDWSIDPENLTTIREIGKGSSGLVMKGVLSQWRGSNDFVVAIKTLGKKTTESEKNLICEFEMLKNLKHDNILKMLGFVAGDEFKIVVEFMPLGSLLTYLRNWQHSQLTNLPLRKYALDIASGMEYLESKNIVHRDLALRNVLVLNQTQVKICDFGLARVLDPNQTVYKIDSQAPLPIYWYAPEALYPNWEFSIMSDVWSFGVVLWEIYSGGCSPKYGLDQFRLKEELRHKRLLRPKFCPDNMFELMHSCWAYMPEDRIPFAEICERIKSQGCTVNGHYMVE